MKLSTAQKLLNPVVLVMGLALSGPGWAEALVKGTLYKDPQCGCCQGHADYLAAQGFAIDVVPTRNLAAIKQQNGVPEKLQGCHTLLIDGYVIEGHVPVTSIRQLLEQKPKIRGIALAGMPAGSPGMMGEKTAPFTVYEIAEGMPKVFSVE